MAESDRRLLITKQPYFHYTNQAKAATENRTLVPGVQNRYITIMRRRQITKSKFIYLQCFKMLYLKYHIGPPGIEPGSGV